MEFKDTSNRRPTGQGSILHGVDRASKDSQKPARSNWRTRTQKRQKTKTLKGNRKTTASCLVIIVIVGIALHAGRSKRPPLSGLIVQKEIVRTPQLV